ncbi:SpoIIE family protein phosphatase [Streptomyces mirabilis]|uniref:SpoIIE family protein phosphatase n=1 Tax=Streptomyces mirabilis TaxID=68239 RepID=UPI003694EAC5
MSNTCSACSPRTSPATDPTGRADLQRVTLPQHLHDQVELGAGGLRAARLVCGCSPSRHRAAGGPRSDDRGRVYSNWRAQQRCPSGLGDETPQAREPTLQQGDRVLCYTDGIIEGSLANGEPFGEERLIRCVNRLGQESSEGVRATELD